MRKFIGKGSRIGKYVAQGAHASVGALLSIGKFNDDKTLLTIPLYNSFVYEWVVGRFTKIVVYVETDEELVAVYEEAKAAGLPASLITDAGLTEFGGVPTLTAVGIGPGDAAEIDKITGKASGKLPLF